MVYCCIFILYSICLEFRERNNNFKEKKMMSLLIYVISWVMVKGYDIRETVVIFSKLNYRRKRYFYKKSKFP